MSPKKSKVSMSRVPPSGHTSRMIRRIALLFTIVALLFVSTGVLIFREADQLMRREPEPLETVVSNIMPNYSQAGFFSLDDQTSLSGWLFPAEGTPKSTIILVHDAQKNRLQFSLDTPYLYEALVKLGYNVLSFDLRHSGQSGGNLSAFGYAEWGDVIAAIAYVRKNTVTRDVILYGFGSGCAAVLIAIDRLPEAGIDQEDLPKWQRKLGFDRTYVRGVLLDTPAMTPDAYIRANYPEEGLISGVTRSAVPYMVRLSAGYNGSRQLTTILTRLQLPVFVSYSAKDNHVGLAEIEPLVSERLRLYPDTTLVHRMETPGSTEGFLKDPEAYVASLKDFFLRFFN